jgi:hypothetical protein
MDGALIHGRLSRQVRLCRCERPETGRKNFATGTKQRLQFASAYGSWNVANEHRPSQCIRYRRVRRTRTPIGIRRRVFRLSVHQGRLRCDAPIDDTNHGRGSRTKVPRIGVHLRGKPLHFRIFSCLRFDPPLRVHRRYRNRTQYPSVYQDAPGAIALHVTGARGTPALHGAQLASVLDGPAEQTQR